MDREREYIPPGPDELSDEIHRTKEKRGAEPGEFLSVENIPSWLNDIGQKRNEDDPLVKIIAVFRGFGGNTQRNIVRQIESERKTKNLDDETTLELLTSLVEHEDDILKSGVSPYKNLETTNNVPSTAGRKESYVLPMPSEPETGTGSQQKEPITPRIPKIITKKFKKAEGKYLGRSTDSHGRHSRKPELPKSLKERGRTRKELQKAAERFQADSER